MKKNRYLLLALSFILGGCSFNPTFSNSSNSDYHNTSDNLMSNSSSESNTSTPITSDDELTENDLFDIHNTISINIDISSEELQKIQNDYKSYSSRGLKSPIYRYAKSVTFTICKNGKEYQYSFDHVGIRMKGNTSRHEFINENNELYNNIHLKLSFEETFDDPNYYNNDEIMTWTEEEKALQEDRTFFNMSKIDLRYNKNVDYSWIREHYALEMFRNFGIMTQRSNFSKVIIKQEEKSINYGVYLLTEPLNKTFIKSRLDDENNYINMGTWKEEKNGTFGVNDSKYGQLYKASYGINTYNPGTGADMSYTDDNLFGVEPDDSSYTPIYDLKTNKKNPDHSLIKQAFNSLKNDKEETIGDYIDLEYFAMYEAVATILGNPDDLRNNYNNYALYFRKTDGKMIIIPIDEDRVLGISKDWDPSNNAMSEVGPFAKKAIGTNNEQHNNLYLKTILDANSQTYQMYKNNLETILKSDWVKKEHFNQMYEIVKNNYEEFSDSSLINYQWSLNSSYNGIYENMSFSEYINKKITIINNALSGQNIDVSTNKFNLSSCNNIYLRYTDYWTIADETNKFAYDSSTELYYFDHKIVEKDIKEFECKVFTTDLGYDLWLMNEYNGGPLKKGDNTVINLNKNDVNHTLRFTLSTKDETLSWEII